MDKIIESIVNKNYEEANGLIKEEIGKIVLSKLHEMKKMIAARNSTLSEAIVQADGLVHLPTGEMVLPSVYRQRRGLTEARGWAGYGFVSEPEKAGYEKQSSELMDKMDTLEDRRAKEIHYANLGVSPLTGEKTARGPETIRDYTQRQHEHFSKAAAASVSIHGGDEEAAANHMRKLVTSVENQHEPWMVSHGTDDDISRDTFRTYIRAHHRQQANLADPAKRAEMDRLAQRRREIQNDIDMAKMVDDHAMKTFLAKKKGLPLPKAPWEGVQARTAQGIKNAQKRTPEQVSKDIDDVIPGLEPMPSKGKK